jgi:2-phosphoglycerate kinase
VHPGAKQKLEHVLWLGGSPCSGKSSIARLLAHEYKLATYHCDDALEQHRPRITPAKQPMLTKWTASTWEKRWMQPLDALVAEAIACYQEHFQLVVEDLLQLPRSAPMLVEGTCLLPNLVAKLLSRPERALWEVPTEAFQRMHYPNRGPWVQEILGQCEDPARARQNWMERDVQLARWVIREAELLGLPVLTVDGQRTIAENATIVAGHFGLG